MMENYIVQYLLDNKECRLSGIGVLKVLHRSAQLDIVHKQMLPPAEEITFTEDTSVHDSGFTEFLAAEKNISLSEAEDLFYTFCEEKKQKLKAGNSWELPTVGFFQKDVNDTIIFIPAKSTIFLKPVPAERVVHKNADHAVLVGDKETTSTLMTEYYRDDEQKAITRWWIAALIIAVLGLAVLAYHFSEHRLNTQGIGNNAAITTIPAEKTHQ